MNSMRRINCRSLAKSGKGMFVHMALELSDMGSCLRVSERHSVNGQGSLAACGCEAWQHPGKGSA